MKWSYVSRGPRPVMCCRAVVWLALFGAACGSSTSTSASSNDGAMDLGQAGQDGAARDTVNDGASSGGLARASGGICLPPSGESIGIVCFGANATSDAQYLNPTDGGSAGHCPTTEDFRPVRGEGCGYVGCGPLLPAAVSALPDAPTIAGAAGPSCCFFVARVCGV